MDIGIWATWYDLPEEGREDYLSWLHEVHIPEALGRTGYSWAAHFKLDNSEERNEHYRGKWTDDPSVPVGNDYLLLFGAESPNTFFNPNPSELAERQTPEAQEMANRRTGVRTCIFTEVGRVNGPEVDKRGPGLTPGPVIQLGSFNPKKPESEEALSSWFAQWRLPSQRTLPGCVGARKLVSALGWAKHAIFYEFASMDAVNNHFSGYDFRFPGIAERTKGIYNSVVHAPGSPSLGTRIWPPA